MEIRRLKVPNVGVPKNGNSKGHGRVLEVSVGGVAARKLAGGENSKEKYTKIEKNTHKYKKIMKMYLKRKKLLVMWSPSGERPGSS